MNKELANAQEVYYVTRKDLPLSCPMDNMTLWNSHQKVYMPIGKTGEVMCEYCGAKYILKED